MSVTYLDEASTPAYTVEGVLDGLGFPYDLEGDVDPSRGKLLDCLGQVLLLTCVDCVGRAELRKYQG